MIAEREYMKKDYKVKKKKNIDFKYKLNKILFKLYLLIRPFKKNK